MERADGKAAGDEQLYICQRIGLERAPTPYQTRRAVRVVTGPLHRMWQLAGTQIAEITCPEAPETYIRLATARSFMTTVRTHGQMPIYAHVQLRQRPLVHAAAEFVPLIHPGSLLTIEDHMS